jgi:citronellol/citronellal dehydrogenase
MNSSAGVNLGAPALRTVAMSLKAKTLFITGASRGIGHAIALRATKDGANIVIAAKTEQEHPKLPGTIYSAAKDVEAAGGKALPVVCDIRSEEAVAAAIEQAVQKFGGIDICINNASAINLSKTSDIDMKRFDLMHQINSRGTFLVSKLCYEHLKKSENPHILNISPPLNMSKRWFAGFVAYTMAKYGMSMCTLGMAEEFRKDGIAVNSLWPETAIATAAVKNLLGGDDSIKGSRTPEIMADSAYIVLNREAKSCTGNFFIDVDVLKEEGITDYSKYAVHPGHELMRDFFLDEWYSAELVNSGRK